MYRAMLYMHMKQSSTAKPLQTVFLMRCSLACMPSQVPLDKALRTPEVDSHVPFYSPAMCLLINDMPCKAVVCRCHQLVLLADTIHPLHEDAICGHLLAPHDCVRVPACVHAAVLQSRGGGPRCARCGRHSSNAWVQRGLHCGPFFWHLCCFKALSVAPYLGAIAGTLLGCCLLQCWDLIFLQSLF